MKKLGKKKKKRKGRKGDNKVINEKSRIKLS